MVGLFIFLQPLCLANVVWVWGGLWTKLNCLSWLCYDKKQKQLSFKSKWFISILLDRGREWNGMEWERRRVRCGAVILLELEGHSHHPFGCVHIAKLTLDFPSEICQWRPFLKFSVEWENDSWCTDEYLCYPFLEFASGGSHVDLIIVLLVLPCMRPWLPC